MLTKNAVGNLINRYKAVLDTCRLLNVLGTCALAGTIVLGGAVGNAWAVDIDAEQVINTDTTITTTINVTDTGFYKAQNNTVTVKDGGAVTVAGDTTIGGTSTPANGLWANSLEISGGTYTAGDATTDFTDIYSGGTLTVSGGTYTATGATTFYNGGTLEVSGGTYKAAGTTVSTGGTLNVSGGTYEATGDTNVQGTLTVSGGTYTTANISVSGGTLTVSGGTCTTGNTSVSTGTFEVSGGTYITTDETQVSGGTLKVSGGTYTAKSVHVTGGTLEVSGGTYAATGKTTISYGNLTVSSGIYNAGSADATWVTTAVKGAGLTANDYTAILAIAQADKLNFGSNSKLNVASGAITNSANFGANSLFVIDGSQFTGTKYALDTDNIDVAADAKLLIASSAVEFVDGAATVNVADANTTLTIDDGAWGYDGEGATASDPDIVDTKTIFTDSQLIDITGVSFDASNNTYTVSLGKVSAGEAFEGMDSSLVSTLDSYKSGTNSFLDKALGSQTADAATTAKSIEGAAKPAVASGLGAALGHVGTASVGNIEMRNGSAQVFSENDTRFMLAMAGDGAILPVDKTQEGFGLWFMPMYKHSSADGFESGNYDYGYDTNIYGATLGADYTFASSLRLGLAFNVGTGDSESTGDFDTTKNDFDYFGLTAYGNMRFGKLALSADLGYTASSNEIDQDNTFGHLTADADASLLSFGMKGEYELDFDSFNLTPYAGVRVNYYNIDSFDTKHQGSTTASTAQSDYTLVEFPVGLTVDTTLQSGGWDITPSLGLGVKFAAGDLDMDQKVRYTGAQSAVLTSEVADAVTFQGALGLGMKKDVYSVDLGYTLDLSENVQSHGVQVNLRYEF